MKKITILAPLMLVPLLLACGNKSGGGSSVSEKEFNDAGRFKDVEYLQIDLHEIMVGDTLNEDEPTEEMEAKVEIAPLINHGIQKTIQDGKESSKTENYVRVNNILDKYCEFIYKDDDAEEWEKLEEQKTALAFCIPVDYSPLAILQIPEGEETDFKFEPEVSYKNFEYKDDKYVYQGEAIFVESNPTPEPEINMPVTLELTFKDKKLVKSFFNFKISTIIETKEFDIVKSDTTMNFAYDEITPTWPITE